jgi:hypothetical protein
MLSRYLLTVLLLGLSASLSIEAYLLYVYSRVPIIFVETTVIAEVVLCMLAYFVAKGVMPIVNIATILGIISPLLSFATPAHNNVLTQLSEGGLITALGLLQILGFYASPIAFVVLRIALREKLRNE